jgi:serine/threonine protein phosphatase PrpC
MTLACLNSSTVCNYTLCSYNVHFKDLLNPIAGDLWSYNSERDTFVVSPEPDITVCKFDHKKHKFIIIASDGLWNMVKPEESVGYVEQLVEEVSVLLVLRDYALKI